MRGVSGRIEGAVNDFSTWFRVLTAIGVAVSTFTAFWSGPVTNPFDAGTVAGEAVYSEPMDGPPDPSKELFSRINFKTRSEDGKTDVQLVVEEDGHYVLRLESLEDGTTRFLTGQMTDHELAVLRSSVTLSFLGNRMTINMFLPPYLRSYQPYALIVTKPGGAGTFVRGDTPVNGRELTVFVGAMIGDHLNEFIDRVTGGAIYGPAPASVEEATVTEHGPGEAPAPPVESKGFLRSLNDAIER